MNLKDWLKLLGLLQFIGALIAQENSQFDINSPIVVSDYYSSSNSLFGWSVTLVQVRTGGSTTNWIFIGDPKGNSTDPSYISNNVIQPGVVWRCSLGRSGLTDQCNIMHLDPQTDNKWGTCNYRDCEDFPQAEFKNDEWVGGAMLSNSERFVTCGPRWTRGGTGNPYMNGICYWFQKNQMYKTWRPEINDLQIDLSKYNHRLAPLFERHNVRSHQSFHIPSEQGLLYDWGLGQFGMSLHMGQRQGMQELMVGAPGMRLYTGSVIIYVDSGQNPQRGQPRANKNRETQFTFFHLVNRESQARGYTAEHYYDYFGFAVTSGKYFGGDEIFYVGGSPRARGGGLISGEVVIFKLPLPTTWTLDPHQILEGGPNMFGSYFGSVLLTVDANSDGKDELLVAAPTCNAKLDLSIQSSGDEGPSSQGSTADTSNIVGDQGCVFVYASSNRNRNGRMLERQTQLFGTGVPGARFGSAMVSLGDINEDGFTDIAIGSPYEDNGQGAVYIFHGGRDTSLNWIWADRITPASFRFPIRFPIQGFGSSLSTGQDIDDNDTPDLAIGSFLTKNVVILRTRPVIRLWGEIHYWHSTKNEMLDSIPHNATSFRVESCVSYFAGRANQNLRLQVTLSLDRDLERFIFTENAKYEENVRADESSCKIFNTRRKQPINDDSRPTAASILTGQLIEYRGDINYGTSQIQQYNIIKSPFGAQPTLKIEGNSKGLESFCSKCPFPSQLSNTGKLEIASECKNPNRCAPRLKILANFEADDQKKVDSVVINWSNTYGVRLIITNDGEPAYNPEVVFSWKSNTDFPAPAILEESLPESCKQGQEKGTYNCTRLNSIKIDKPANLLIKFKLSGIYGKEEEQVLTLDVTVKSGLEIKSTTSTLSLTSIASVKISGSTTDAKNGVPMTDRFTQVYTVSLTGQTHVETISVGFKFPISSKISGDILMVSKPKENVECRTEDGDFSILPDETSDNKDTKDKLTDETTDPPMNDTSSVIASRRKRQVKGKGEEGYKDLDPENGRELADVQTAPNQNENTTYLRCTDSDTNCMRVICKLSNVYRGAMPRISFEMLMNQENSAKLFGDKDKIIVQSDGDVQILGGKKVGQKGRGYSQTTISKFQKVVGGEEIAPWIYFVSGIGGLIILFLIIVGLRQIGFFRRKTKEELQELIAQAEVQDHLQAANNVPNFDNLGEDQQLQH